MCKNKEERAITLAMQSASDDHSWEKLIWGNLFAFRLSTVTGVPLPLFLATWTRLAAGHNRTKYTSAENHYSSQEWIVFVYLDFNKRGFWKILKMRNMSESDYPWSRNLPITPNFSQFFGPAELVWLIICRFIGNHPDRESMMCAVPKSFVHSC